MRVLDNESPRLYKDAIEQSKFSYQLVPSNNHRRNAAERAIRTFKEHFLRIIARFHKKLPMSMCDHLIEQTVITLNLLRQSLVHSHLSAYAHYYGTLN